jgi:flagellar basal body rod protein FlgG
MDGITWAGSAMVAARVRLDIATSNLANASTDGFSGYSARGFMTGEGVRIERESNQRHGGLRRTGRDFDLAIVGAGAFQVRDASGSITTTRDGAFTRERNGTLTDARGSVVIGERGAVVIPENARIDERGFILSGDRRIDRIVVPDGSTVHSGYLESAGVDAISEMVDVMSAERSFETAQKVVSAIDGTRQKSASEVARVK